MLDFNELFNGYSQGIVALLVVTAFFTSMFTASFGAGGGVMMLGVMAQVVPPKIIIPLHGFIQLGSNSGRAIMSWKHIDWKLISMFAPGVVLGAIIGFFVLVSLPPEVMYLSIAGFILFLCWGPKIPSVALGKTGILIAGLVTSFIGLFVGASGPLVGAFVKQVHIARLTTIATFAIAMSLQHITKLVVFGVAGFEFMPWLPLLILMIVSGSLGTWVGLKFVKRMSDVYFNRAFNIVLTCLALRLVWQALF